MDRKGHYFPGASKPRCPGVVFGVACHTINTAAQTDGRITNSDLGSVYAAVSYRRRNGWTTPQDVRLSRGVDLFSWLHERALIGRINWIVCPVASETLTLTQWWAYAEQEGFRWSGEEGRVKGSARKGGSFTGIDCKGIVPWGRVNILDYRHRGRRFRWVSACNYWPDGPPQERTGTGFCWPSPSASPIGEQRPLSQEAETVHGIVGAFRRLSDWWGRVAKAPFGTTTGQLSWGMLRTHCPERVLTSHSVDAAHTLEREASYGGRASCWYVGRIADKTIDCSRISRTCMQDETPIIRSGVTQVDIVSMYPHLLSSREYPVRFIKCIDNARRGDAIAFAKDIGVIACVTIRTIKPEYPCRKGDRVIYPIGQFTTVLTGPELLALEGNGEVLKCHRLATYTMGRPFARFADVLMGMRNGAHLDPSGPDAKYLKLLANTLPGKLSQRKGRWKRNSHNDGQHDWGEHFHYNTRTEERKRMRYLLAVCWQWEPDLVGQGKYTFAFAYLAAYGRLLMRSVRETLPQTGIVSQDTDGLWLLPHALHDCGKQPGFGSLLPGTLRVTDQSSYARFYGPRHYLTDAGWVLAGFHEHEVEDDLSSIWDSYTFNPAGIVPTAPPGRISTLTRCSKFPLELSGGSVDKDGWVRPRFLKPHSIDMGDTM